MTESHREGAQAGQSDAGIRVRQRGLGTTGLLVSELGLGGHEFGNSRYIRGFHDDLYRALTPGVIMPGFGGPDRLALLSAALEWGVDFFDVTIDSEKDALGRNLHELGALDRAVIQTRPCGFVYTYDPGNRSFLDREALFREVERLCGLLRRDRLDVLNVGLEGDALAQPGYLDTLGANLLALKQAGLIRLAGCDSFSGGSAYETMVASGLFDVLYIIYNPLADFPETSLFPLAQARGMGVVIKEAFLKGAVFEAAASAGIDRADFGRVALTVLRWILRRPEVSTVLVGTGRREHLAANLQASGQPPLGEEERALIERLRSSEKGGIVGARQKWAFDHGLPPNVKPPDHLIFGQKEAEQGGNPTADR